MRNASTNEVVSRSYCNLNSAYLGFDHKQDGQDQLEIAGYDPVTGSGGIEVNAGTYTTDLKIKPKEGTVKSKSVKLTPSLNTNTSPDPTGNISYSSELHDWTLYQDDSEIWFKVGAAINTPKGIYYLNWKIEEVPNESSDATADTTHYTAPPKTRVEVVEKGTNNEKKFNVVALADTLKKGTKSPYIKVSVSNAPFTDVTVKLSLASTDTTTVKFSPESLIFNSSDTEKYFQIEVTADYDLSKPNQTVNWELAGTDKEAFQAPGPMTVDIFDKPANIAAPKITGWGDAGNSQNVRNFAPTVDQVGQIWWALGAKGSTADSTTGEGNSCPTLEVIKQNAAEPTVAYTDMSTEQKTNYDLTNNKNQTQEADPADGETWVQFQQRLYKTHLMTSYFGIHIVPDASNAGTITADYLQAETDYQMCGYLENIYGDVSTISLDYWVTGDADPNYEWSIGVSATTSVINLDGDKVRDIVSLAQGVNPKRNQMTVVDGTAGGSTRRRLNTTTTKTFTSVLMSDRSKSEPTTQTLAFLSTDEATGVFNDIKTASGNTALTQIGSGYSSSAYAPDQETVGWVTGSAPALGSKTHNSVTIKLQSDNTHGELACTVVDNYPEGATTNNFKPSQAQVFLGLDTNNMEALVAKKIPAASDATPPVAATEMVLEGLSKGTKYHAFCTATNGAVGMPGLIGYNSLDNFTAIGFTTDGEADVDDDDDDFALLTSSNIVALTTMLVALIFN